MSLKLQFASLSMGASVDQQTGNLSVFDIVDELRSSQVPFYLQSLVISVVLQKTAQVEFTGKMLIHLLTPDGKQQPVGTGDLRVPREQARMKAVFRYGNFPVLAYGQHRFVLSWVNSENTKVGEAILDFNAVQVTEVAQGVTTSDRSKPLN
jgi:hypothetical protein